MISDYRFLFSWCPSFGVQIKAKRKQAQKLVKWGQLFEDAPIVQKQMILAEIVDRIEVGRGYRIHVKFKLTARQFIEPDAGKNR